MDEYYTAREAAEKLGLQYPTLLARVRNGKYRHTRIGWQILINKSDIDEAVKNATTCSDVESPAG